MHTHSCTISLCYMHTASFSWGPPHGSSSSFWERPDCRASVLFPSISQSKLNQQKAAASVTASAYQIKTPGSIECISVMCQRAGTKPGATVDGPLEIRLRYQNQRVENLSPMTLSFCRMFWFSEIQRQSSLDEKCRYLLLKTVYFLLLFCCYRGTGYLLFALCYCLNRMLIKGKMGIRGKRLYKFFS